MPKSHTLRRQAVDHRAERLTSGHHRLPLIATIFIAASCFVLSPALSQTLTSVSPPTQRVHEYIELTGSSFGTTQGSSLVRFTDGTEIWDAGRAYIWRDNYIRIRVPVGRLDGGATIVPISKDPLGVFV